MDLADKLNDYDFSKGDEGDGEDDHDLMGMYNDLLDDDNDQLSNQFVRSSTQLEKDIKKEA